ncbi:hypothetical protein, partial [Silanimonas sp.]|uniref:hypothetical protein n=1 Tax=Silanimonas sp. TaxID=1929290 RepID=UPI001BC2EF81
PLDGETRLAARQNVEFRPDGRDFGLQAAKSRGFGGLFRPSLGGLYHQTDDIMRRKVKLNKWMLLVKFSGERPSSIAQKGIELQTTETRTDGVGRLRPGKGFRLESAYWC